MRAIRIADDHTLEFVEIAEPEPRPGEVLIDVVSAGVNRADLAQAAGSYPAPPGASPLPGLEVSGRRRDTGEEVVALLAGGGYAEVVAVPEVQVLPAPTALSLSDAGGLIEVAATVVSNLDIEAELGADETVLIHGGTGGIGTFAIQFARARGSRVLTTVGSDEAVRIAVGLGAHEAWNRHATDIPEAVGDAGGADVILDVIGGPALDDNVGMLREFGRLVIIGTIGGASGELNAGTLLRKRARIIGTALRSRRPDDKQRILRRTHELVWPLLESGAIRLPIHERLPLAEAARAHEILRAGGHIGKIVLVP